MLKRLQKVLFDHEVAQMPQEIKHRKNVILTVSIISTAILDVLSFAVKGAQTALSADMKLLAFALILLYFVREVLQKSVQTFTDQQKNDFAEKADRYITGSIFDISNVVRGKVFQKKNEHSLIMTNSEVIFNLKEYIDYLWKFWQNLPFAISDILTALVMSIAILITEFVQTGDLALTLCFTGVLFGCIIFFSFLYYIRLKVRSKYRDNHRILRKENDVLLNDVKNIEPLIKKEFAFRAKLIIQNMKKKRELEKKEELKLNTLQLLRTFVLAVFMVFIIMIKLHHVGGIKNFDLLVLTDILAISAVYSNILDKIASILRNCENIANIISDAERVKPDVDNIMNVYKKENNIKISSDIVEKITVNPFDFTYPGSNSVYTLKNSTSFELESGKSYLVYGHTGCGKSTLMHLIIGKILMDVSPISYGEFCQEAYLSSIMHESNGKLGVNPVLKELIFNNDTSKLDRSRLIEILHGTHIYEDIMRNIGLSSEDDDKVLEYLSSTTIEQYSSGQKQRLAIVKVLYNLSLSHQIVVFDEATNALDDTTAVSVLRFMTEYCQKDMKRIVMFVSHQVDLTKEIVDGKITFVSNTFPVFEIVPEL